MSRTSKPWPLTADALWARPLITRNDAGQVAVFGELWEAACKAGDLGPELDPPFNSPETLWEAWKHQRAKVRDHPDLVERADRLAAKHGFVALDRGERSRPPRYWFERRSSVLALAGVPRVTVEAAAEYLVNGYNAWTVEYYDCGGESPCNVVTTDDIGRLTVFAAQLTYESAQEYLRLGNTKGLVRWPKTDLTLDLTARADDEESFIASRAFTAASEVFGDLLDDGWAIAQTSKLLHLKWPDFFPIVDSVLRSVYAEIAVEIYNEHFRDGRRRRRSARSLGPEPFWPAVRRDLLDSGNAQAMKSLRAEIRKVDPSGENGHDAAHRKRLAGLGDLRLLDMVAWGVGTENLSG